MSIRSGSITAFYLFDIADEIDLSAVQRVLRTATARARLEPKPYTPAYLQYQTPPLLIEAEALELPEIAACRVRIKVYDYGIVSLALSRPFAGTWDELIAAGVRVTGLDAEAAAMCATIAERLTPALVRGRAPDLSEDYVVFAVTELSERMSAEELIAQDGDAIASLLRGEERGRLSRQERDEVLRHRISYLEDDLIVPTWSTAFVCDTEAGAQAALEIFEFANSQLLEFRYYDDLLDSELARIYDSLERPRWYDWLGGRRLTREAYELHALFIDVNELTDKTGNAIKMVGDVYAARLYALVSARLGLERWKANVEEKLDTLDDIYRFAVGQTQMSRANLLELTIVFILVLELILVFMGIMK
jgi:hypothetical protein